MSKAGHPATSQEEKALASTQDKQEKIICMNVNIAKTFHKQIKQGALDEDTTVTDIVIKALKLYMDKEI